MKKIHIILVLFMLSSSLAADDLKGKKLLCPKLLWGFEFISSEKVNVISTNINNQTSVKQYYYEIDFELSYVNLYLSKNNTKNAVLSIHREKFRVDIWTMTSGGNTTREIIPAGFCKVVKIHNIIEYIESLKT